jgi:hypothetical protein
MYMGSTSGLLDDYRAASSSTTPSWSTSSSLSNSSSSVSDPWLRADEEPASSQYVWTDAKSDYSDAEFQTTKDQGRHSLLELNESSFPVPGGSRRSYSRNFRTAPSGRALDHQLMYDRPTGSFEAPDGRSLPPSSSIRKSHSDGDTEDDCPPGLGSSTRRGPTAPAGEFDGPTGAIGTRRSVVGGGVRPDPRKSSVSESDDDSASGNNSFVLPAAAGVWGGSSRPLAISSGAVPHGKSSTTALPVAAPSMSASAPLAGTGGGSSVAARRVPGSGHLGLNKASAASTGAVASSSAMGASTLSSAPMGSGHGRHKPRHGRL